MLEKVPLLAPLRVKRNLNLQSNTCGFVIHLPPLKTPQNPLKTSFKYVYGSGFVLFFSFCIWIQCTGRIGSRDTIFNIHLIFILFDALIVALPTQSTHISRLSTRP